VICYACRRYSADPAQSFNVSFPVYLGAQYDASTTNFTYQIPAPSGDGSPVRLTVSFFSPVTPTSTLRQGIPASYINVIAEGGLDVDIYMDVNGLWVTGDRNSEIEWDFTKVEYEDAPHMKTWGIKRSEELLFTENEDRAEWGRLLFSGPSVSRSALVRFILVLTVISGC
jgi:hypothetical protein